MLAALLGACEGAPAIAPTEEVFLPPGAGFNEMTDSLVAHHVVVNRRWFGVLARIGRYDRRLKAGFYELKQGEAPLTVLKTLVAGTEKTTRFTVPEGFTLLDIAQAAESTLGLPVDSIPLVDPSEMADTVVDVRQEPEWAAGHLPQAEHLGKGVIERDIEASIPDTTAEIILYCGGGYRSALAADNLQKMGYTNVWSMDGGFRGWKEAGLPVVK